jgi:uncharacterized membrane-anchored protein YhcB (DUF1043 family)
MSYELSITIGGEEMNTSSWVFLSLGGLVILATAYWIILWLRSSKQVNKYLQQLKPQRNLDEYYEHLEKQKKIEKFVSTCELLDRTDKRMKNLGFEPKFVESFMESYGVPKRH